MNNTDKLKRLAEFMVASDFHGCRFYPDQCAEYSKAILALIAENERLKGEREDLLCLVSETAMKCGDAVELLREWDRVGIDGTGGNNLEDTTEDFLSRIDAKDTQ